MSINGPPAMPTFEPGPGVALLADGCLVLVEGCADPVIERLWAAATSTQPLERVLAELTREGVGATPPFVCVATEGDRSTVLVRGTGRVVARLADGADRQVTSEGQRTWVEVRIDGAISFSAWLRPPPSEPTIWRAARGVLPAAAVHGWPEGAALVPSLPDASPPPAVLMDPVLSTEPVPPPLPPAAASVPPTPPEPSVSPEPPPASVSSAPQGPPPQPEPPAASVPPAQQEPSAPPVPPAQQEPTVPPEPTALPEPPARVDPDRPLATVEPPAGASGLGGEFDFGHLLDHTMYFGTEAAALRATSDEPADGSTGPTPSAPPPPPPPRTAPPPPPPPPPDGDITLLPPDEVGLGLSQFGLIDSVPMGMDSRGSSPTTLPAVTRARAAPPVSNPEAVDPNSTVSNVEVRALLRQAQAAEQAQGAGPTVLAVRCDHGHLNPPEAEVCRYCGEVIRIRSIAVVSRPSLGRLRFDIGKVVELTGPLLVGRKPPSDEQVNGEMATAVLIPDPDQLLSRLHLEVRLEGWQVLVVDRRSVNATYVTAPGKAQLQIRPGEPQPIVPGTTVSLGDIVSFVYEVDRA